MLRDHFCPSPAPQGCCFKRLCWTWALSPVHVCCHTVYDVNIPPFMYNFSQPPPSAPSSCYAAAGSLPKILQLLPALSSSSSLPLLFTFYFFIGQQNVCHIQANAEALLLFLPLPLPLSLSLLCCLTEPHSGYVRAKVKVSLPLSRET